MHADRPFGYHLVNVLGHAGVSALVVVFAQRFGLALRTAALAGALFAVHPIHTEVVANAVGRAEILAAALALLALLARLTPGPTATAGAAVAYALALLAKEHTIALLALLPLVDFLFTDGRSLRLFARRLAGERGVFYAVLLGIAGGYLALRAVALGHVVGTLGEIAFCPRNLGHSFHRHLTACP